MKKKEKINKTKIIFSITIGLLCFLISFMICIQFKTVDSVNESEIETMREDELRNSLAEWKEKYSETEEELNSTNQKISEYKDKINSNQESGELIEEELESSKKSLGITDVEGSGIVINMSDNSSMTITYENLLELVNELNSAGAEAISINGERVVAMTDIVELSDTGFILVNGKRITSPYTIKAIGDQTYLQSAISIKGGYLDSYKTNGYTISISTENKMTIEKYTGEIKSNYMSEEN